jgi:DNA (cytosine-5)-methyltransferase 1
MRVGSLFSGIGGLDLGFEWAGFEPAWFCEIEPYPCEVLKRHWPGIPIINDVRDVTRESVSPVDVLIGGFPCQDISYAGKGAGIDYDLSTGEGTRSGLWWEYWRVIRELRPRYVVAENVAALLGRGLDVVLGSLAEIGYDAEWTIVSAASVSAPHIRERVFIVAYPCGIGLSRAIPINGGTQGGQTVPTVRGEDRNINTVAQANAPRGVAFEWSEDSLRVVLAGHDDLVEMGRAVHGVSGELDAYEHRMKTLGNAVVPRVAYLVAMAVRQHAEETGRWV